MVISILVALSLDFMTGSVYWLRCLLPTFTIGRLQHARAAYDAMGIGAWPAGAAARDEREAVQCMWWPWAYRFHLTGN